MSRAKNIVPTEPLFVRLPAELKAKLDLHLFSEVEGRVPFGSHQTFISERLRDFFSSESLDLSPYAPLSAPGTLVVRGSPTAIQLLKRILET